MTTPALVVLAICIASFIMAVDMTFAYKYSANRGPMLYIIAGPLLFALTLAILAFINNA